MPLGDGAALPQLITISDAATAFGRNERTIRRWIDKGDLPCVRMSRQSIFICADDIRTIISNRTTKRALRGR